MKPWLKRTLLVVGGLVLLLVVFVGSVAYSAFGGMAAIVDGVSPTPAVRVVKDGFVDYGVVDLGGGKLALVDAGNDHKGAALDAELARRKLTRDAVVAVFLTHGHADHMGVCLGTATTSDPTSASAPCHGLPRAKVYALQPDVGLAEGSEGSHGFLTRMFPHKATGVKVTHPLHDGEVVSFEGSTRQIRTFAIPGHTAGSAAFLVDGVLFLGDSAGMTSHGTLAGSARPFSDDPAQNRAALKSLADKLRPEKATIVAIVPAHTATGPESALDQFVP